MSLVTFLGANAGGGTVDVVDGAMRVQPKSEFLQAVEDGLAFSWSGLTEDFAALDTYLLVENNSTDYNLCVEQVMVATDASGQIVIYTCSGVTVAGDAVTGVNLNRKSAYVAPATAKRDESGNGEQAAGYLTRVATCYALANQPVDIYFGGSIILPYDYCIGVDATAEPTGGAATIIGYFKAVS